jgi:hypothetical protein
VATLWVAGQRGVLVVNDDGAEDTLARALRQAAIPVEVSAPDPAVLGRIALTGVRAVVLENVRRASRLRQDARAARVCARARRRALDDRWQGELRHRRYHLAHRRAPAGLDGDAPGDAQDQGRDGVALDRSGSMAVEAAPSVEVQLANLGTCAAVELLAPIDSVGVIAVDSAPHLRRVPVRDVASITARVRTIESSGGGIFCYTALVAAGKMLEDAVQKNRHAILFADANDSEEQEDCPELVERFRAMGITLSVVALGTEADSDAAFLKHIAELGGGQCYFTHDPAELPRLFAQDTLTIARATFVEEPVACTALPDLFGLGEIPGGTRAFPDLGGHNVTWLREATCGVVTQSGSVAGLRLLAGRPRARRRCRADRRRVRGGLVAWDGFASFFVTAVRWLGGREPGELFASARRQGRVAVGRGRSAREHAPDTSNLGAPDGRRRQDRDAAARARGRARVRGHDDARARGVVLGSARSATGARSRCRRWCSPQPRVRGRRRSGRGEECLRQIARESGGEVAPPLGTLFRGERRARAWRVVARECALAALVLLLVEIAMRRLQLWSALAGLALPLRRLRERRRRVAPVQPSPARVDGPPQVASPAVPEATAAAAGPRPAVKTASLDDALAKARRAADRELGR